MYKGVPTIDDIISFLKLSTVLANPKSASLYVYIDKREEKKNLFNFFYAFINKYVCWFKVPMDDTIFNELDETIENIC